MRAAGYEALQSRLAIIKQKYTNHEAYKYLAQESCTSFEYGICNVTGVAVITACDEIVHETLIVIAQFLCAIWAPFLSRPVLEIH